MTRQLEDWQTMQILTIESQPFAENSYVVWHDGGTEAFVIDPGFEPDLIREALADNGADPRRHRLHARARRSHRRATPT